MSEETKPYIVQPDGLTCKAENPYNRMQMGCADLYAKFEQHNPALPIATDKAMQPGLVFEGVEVWQLKPIFCNHWENVIWNDKYSKEDQLKIHHTTRIAVQPKVVSPAKGEGEKPNPLLNITVNQNGDRIPSDYKSVSKDNLHTESIDIQHLLLDIITNHKQDVITDDKGRVYIWADRIIETFEDWQKSQPDNRVVVNDEIDYKKAYEDLLYQVKQNINLFAEKSAEYEATNHEDTSIKHGFECKAFAYKYASTKLIKSLEWLGIIN